MFQEVYVHVWMHRVVVNKLVLNTSTVLAYTDNIKVQSGRSAEVAQRAGAERARDAGPTTKLSAPARGHKKT